MQALILAGGSGTRFWPASRRRRPKQLLPLAGEATLLAATRERLGSLADAVWVSTTSELAPAVRAALPDLPADHVLAEPAGRNTAPAIGWALLAMPEAARRDVVAVLPADHRVEDPEAFRAAMAVARDAAASDDLVVTLGIRPTHAETGYGWLELVQELPLPAGGGSGTWTAGTGGTPLAAPAGTGAEPGSEFASRGRGSGPSRVARFIEKPDRATAERLLATGALWNGGIFVFRGTTLLSHLERLAPEIARGLAAAAASPERAAELYGALPSISIDYAVMEKLADLATVPLDCGWSDLGSWAALADVLPRDASGNAARGDVLALDAADNVLWSEGGALAVLGVSGLIAVRTADAVLVVPRDRAQEVRRLVDALAARGRKDLL